MKQPQPYPHWLHDVWAKSPTPPATEGESLAQHTWNVLDRLADLVRLRPDLPQGVGEPRLWHRLFWACWLHDLGKASDGFQVMVKVKDSPAWGRRHEVLSLAFVPWLDFGEEDKLWIVAAIASHHKDPGDDKIREYTRDCLFGGRALIEMIYSVPDATLRGIWRWIDECRTEWIQNLGIDPTIVELPELLTPEQALHRFKHDGANDICDLLDEFVYWTETFSRNYDHRAKTAPILLRGLIIRADHTASAHTGNLEPITVDADNLLARWEEKAEGKIELHTHQRAARDQSGSALLVAPTGSGKTEAALLWAARQADGDGRLSRLFYTLPHQTSMNAMQMRLGDSFSESKVGLQHGRSLLALYKRLMDKDYTKHQAKYVARRERDLAKLNFYPVRVFSPYQMLKAFYRLKGYEPFLADYYGATFIFDEIHAYEPSRLALILKSVEHLRKHYAARFLFMSATFPSLVKGKLREALGEVVPELRADVDLFAKFIRHRLCLLDGELLDSDSLDQIAGDAALGRYVLVCCNTVHRAQKAYEELGKRLPKSIERLLLHGRFHGRDRLQKERAVWEATGSRSEIRKPIVLIATQVVEVSLDIDLDTIYTDPAPLEALVQRFGRVNRQRLQPDLAPVHVFRQPDDGQHIYDPQHVKGALCILERIDGQPVDEASVGGWLDEVYTGEVAQRWQEEYDDQARQFDQAFIRGLRAFAAADRDLEREFNRLFDSVEVLPATLKDEYTRQVENGDEIDATELLVSIRYGQLMMLDKAKKVVGREGDLPPVVLATYDEQGLHLND